jgi:hypothetical protein
VNLIKHELIIGLQPKQSREGRTPPQHRRHAVTRCGTSATNLTSSFVYECGAKQVAKQAFTDMLEINSND